MYLQSSCGKSVNSSTIWVCYWKCCVPHSTQWFSWSLSLWKMAISLGIYPIFRQTHFCEIFHCSEAPFTLATSRAEFARPLIRRSRYLSVASLISMFTRRARVKATAHPKNVCLSHVHIPNIPIIVEGKHVSFFKQKTPIHIPINIHSAPVIIEGQCPCSRSCSFQSLHFNRSSEMTRV